MKRISLFVFMVLPALIATNVTEAQKFSLGARGGISIPNLTAGSSSNPLNNGYKSRFGPDFGIYGEYHFSSLFSIVPLIEYSSQGGKKNGFQAMTVPDEFKPLFPPGQVPPYLYANYKSEAKLNYLLVPILAKFGWKLSGPFRIYADVGPFAGFLLSAKQVTSGSSIIYADAQMQQPVTATAQSFDDVSHITDQLHKFNFGVSGNLGIAYHFNRSNIFIEGGGNYGFLNIQKGTENGKNNTGAGTVAFGYGHAFGK